MATSVVKQFLATIRSGASITWSLADANPPFRDGPFEDRQPNWIIVWQAVPIFFAPDSAAGQGAVPGIRIDPVTIAEQVDTSLTHVFTISCVDFANTGAGFVATYVLYAVFFDV